MYKKNELRLLETLVRIFEVKLFINNNSMEGCCIHCYIINNISISVDDTSDYVKRNTMQNDTTRDMKGFHYFEYILGI